MTGTIPLILLTGFLGAGKTTWLRSMLSAESYGNTAVLVNEFGDVGIDHLLVDTIAPDIVLLQSGCICCQIRSELKDAILDLVTKRHTGEIPKFERIVIETTGLADPGKIFSTLLLDPVLRNQVSLKDVVTIVDAVNGNNLHAEQPEWHAQVSAASSILLSKTDLAEEERVQAITNELANINPAAQIGDARLVSDIFDLSGSEMLLEKLSEVKHVAHRETETLTLCIEEQIDWVAFIIWLSSLIHKHGEKLLRVKCLLNTEQNGVLLLNGVGHTLYHPDHLEEGFDKKTYSRLVFIARGLDAKLIERSFYTYVVGAEQLIDEGA